MPSRLIRIAHPTLYNFSDVAASLSREQVLADRIDASEYLYAALSVRVHGGYSIAQANAKIEVFARPDPFTTDDPGADWDYSQVSAVGTVTIPYKLGANVPFFDGGGWDCFYNGLIQIVVKGTQAAQQSDVEAILSIDLQLKR